MRPAGRVGRSRTQRAAYVRAQPRSGDNPVAHDEGQSIRQPDGTWIGRCKGCGWEGPPRPHMFDTGPDLVEHEREHRT